MDKTIELYSTSTCKIIHTLKGCKHEGVGTYIGSGKILTCLHVVGPTNSRLEIVYKHRRINVTKAIVYHQRPKESEPLFEFSDDLGINLSNWNQIILKYPDIAILYSSEFESLGLSNFGDLCQDFSYISYKDAQKIKAGKVDLSYGEISNQPTIIKLYDSNLKPGDSGSLVFNKDGSIIGMCIGGNLDQREAYLLSFYPSITRFVIAQHHFMLNTTSMLDLSKIFIQYYYIN